METNKNVKFKLADITLPNGILRVDKIISPLKTDFTLGHYALPEIVKEITRKTIRVQNNDAYIINNGNYQLAMISLNGWHNLAFTATKGLHPVSENSTLISAKDNFEGEKIFITLQLWKKGEKAFTAKELSPVKSVKIAEDKNSVEVIFNDGSVKKVVF
ncbi:MAG: hypothetical protein EOO87_19520 [Pedobacter sp.]|nr:MAG: hypothetical protein EOO87_19520 [Pedobacter sp.]